MAADDARDELVSRFQGTIATMGPGALRDVLRQLADHGPGGNPFTHEPAPSQRRPRRDDVVTYRVRVDLVGAKPPLWRRLELASDLMLHEVHDVLQAAFGWTDSHLHRFARGPRYYHPATEYYLCPFDVDEGDEGVPEHEVRLDEVLVEPGDVLFYNYDFGDEWQHVVKLEAFLAPNDAAPRAVCTGGRRPGPAEDSGGIGGYELMVAATDPAHPEHAAAVAEYRQYYGEDADLDYYRPTPFDLDEINTALSRFGDGSQEP